jgi:NADPH:quinone reductase
VIVPSVLVPVFGGPEVLEIGGRHCREPGPGEMRISVAAATVNNTDLLLRSGAQEQFLGSVAVPYTPGMECAGVVEAVGTDVPTEVGSRVAAIVSAWRDEGGAQSGSVVVSADATFQPPLDMAHVEAATLPMNGLTALLALEVLALEGEETIAVTGSVGAVGGYVVQLARARRIRVIADATRADEGEAGRLGADAIVHRGPDWSTRVRRVVPDGVDGVVDAAGLGEGAVAAVRDGGAVASLRGKVGLTTRGIEFKPVFVPDHLHDRNRLATVRGAASKGVLIPRIAETLPVSQVALAHQRLATGGARGRLVLTF